MSDAQTMIEFAINTQDYQLRLAIIRGIAIGCVILLCVAGLGILFEDYFDE